LSSIWVAKVTENTYLCILKSIKRSKNEEGLGAVPLYDRLTNDGKIVSYARTAQVTSY